MQRYAWWGRPGYEYFYYFSTPLKRWCEFKGRVWPTMPRSVERRILRVLDVFLTYTGYAERYRRRKLKYLRQLRSERTEQVGRRKADARKWAEAMAENLRSIGTPADRAHHGELERRRQAWASRMAKRNEGDAMCRLEPPGNPLPAPDLSDIDHIHRMIATNRLADIFTRLAGGGEGDDDDQLPAAKGDEDREDRPPERPGSK